MYYTDLFSPDTYERFSASEKTVSGFRETQLSTAKNVQVGDKLICYVTKLSRWVGVLEVISLYFEDNKPIFTADSDPYIVRFNVKPLVWLPLDTAIPIYEDIVWQHLSFTKNLEKWNLKWTGKVRGSLTKLNDPDGRHLERLLVQQVEKPVLFELTEDDKRKRKVYTVKTEGSKEVAVSVPDDVDKEVAPVDDPAPARESLKIQAFLAQIGEKMGMKIWLPRNDRSRILALWQPNEVDTVLDNLPLNYDDTTLKTIENIDVLWIKRRSIVRAFEVEHSTSIYSGILRMADLMALQPNLAIKAHIVAPSDRREKVLQEINRPVFTLLEKGPLAESCTFIPYDAIIELSREKRIEYMSDRVLEEFVEYGES